MFDELDDLENDFEEDIDNPSPTMNKFVLWSPVRGIFLGADTESISLRWTKETPPAGAKVPLGALTFLPSDFDVVTNTVEQIFLAQGAVEELTHPEKMIQFRPVKAGTERYITPLALAYQGFGKDLGSLFPSLLIKGKARHIIH